MAEQDSEHGGVFMTLGDGFHAIDLTQRARGGSGAQPAAAHGQIRPRPRRLQGRPATPPLRDAYTHLLDRGVEILRALDHVCQRSVYFTDPDGNGLEIYYEMPNALALFPNGRGDEDERLPLTAAGEPLPAWLTEDWPGASAMAKVERLARQPAAAE